MSTMLMITLFAFLICYVAAFQVAPRNQLLHTITRSQLSMLVTGDEAPAFSLKNKDGKTISSTTYKGKKPMVVFFYPADNTPGCTTEACAFERRAPDFAAAGAVVLGISSGSAADKEKFVRANKLNSMELLIDEGEAVRKSWEVPRALFGAFPGRVTYVVGKDGKVQGIYDDLAKADVHPEKALEVLAANAAEPKQKKFGLF